MRIAFYAPMKAPDHPVPSGDRRIAGLLLQALRLGGHDVEVASRLRSHEGRGDGARQRRIRAAGRHRAAGIAARYRARPPDLWFTYHLYLKAPDWIGPAVSRALAIPYLAADASHAAKRASGPWRDNWAMPLSGRSIVHSRQRRVRRPATIVSRTWTKAAPMLTNRRQIGADSE